MAVYGLGHYGENDWRRYLCDTFGVGARISVADLHRAYSMTYKRPLPLQRDVVKRLGDYMAQMESLGYVSAAPGPRGGKGWTIEPTCPPEWILGYVGNRVRRMGKYSPPQ